jgi:hypothetical protein
MDQSVMLNRILEILRSKIMMGAGEGGRIKRVCAGYLDSSSSSSSDDIMGEGKLRKRRKAGVMAGKRKCKAGVMAGVSAGKKRKCKAGVSAGKKTSNPWIEHVKAYAKKHNVPYRVAMSKARDSY